MRYVYFSLIFLSCITLLGCPSEEGSSDDDDSSTSTPTPEPTASPTAVPYSVGGTMTGLGGTVTLQNNGGDDLNVSADGAFTFSTTLSDGDAYAVTFGSQPSSEHCFLQNPSGNVATADVSNVIANCSWTVPTSLTDNFSPDNENVTAGTVAMDNNGNSIIVWLQSTGAEQHLFKSEYRSGAWTHPSGISDHVSVAGSSAGQARVAMDNNGNAIIVWTQDGTGLMKTEYRSGAWSAPAAFGGFAGSGNADIAMGDNDEAIIVWQYNGGTHLQIYKSEYRSGSWTHPASVADNISPDGQHAEVVTNWTNFVQMDNAGNIIVVWIQKDGVGSCSGDGCFRLFKAEYRASAWDLPSSLTDFINPANASDVNDPDIAMDNNGNAIIVWKQISGGSTARIFKSEYRSSAWTHPSNDTDYISPTGGERPRVAMDDSGNAIIAWYQPSFSPERIFKSEYRNGTWTHPANVDDFVNPDTGGGINWVEVAISNGIPILSWHQSDGFNTQIFKSEYRNSLWVLPTSISDYINPPTGAQGASSPSVAVDSSGNTIIVWNQHDGTATQYFKAEYR